MLYTISLFTLLLYSISVSIRYLTRLNCLMIMSLLWWTFGNSANKIFGLSVSDLLENKKKHFAILYQNMSFVSFTNIAF